jgi:hypothetical protein
VRGREEREIEKRKRERERRSDRGWGVESDRERGREGDITSIQMDNVFVHFPRKEQTNNQ